MTTPRISTAEELSRWIAAAQPGTEVVYHEGRTGSLAARAGSGEISRLARDARHFDERGFIFLVQRKIGDSRYEWLARRSSRRLR